jgi:thiosulfate/3-mercaptopyruvate sulfurtransferase
MNKDLLIILWVACAGLLSLPFAHASCPPGGCGSGVDYWMNSAQDFINTDAPIVGVTQDREVQTGSFVAGKPSNLGSNATDATAAIKESDRVQPARNGLFLRGEFLEPLASISSSAVLVDVSDEHPDGSAHIKGAFEVPAKSFLYDNRSLRSLSEIRDTLGKAGISRDDRVAVYGISFGSGEAAFAVWLLRYLGQKDVSALDGGLDDWTRASLPMETKKNDRAPTNYTPSLRPELLADYDYVNSGAAQLVDARSFIEYGQGRIKNALLISSDQMLEGGRIRPGDDLNQTFATLDRKRPVVVYSDDPYKTSLVWYALLLMGYDSRIYTWQDWQAHVMSRTYTIK